MRLVSPCFPSSFWKENEVTTITLSEPPAPEPYFSIPQASKRLGIPEYALRAAAKDGLFPLYRPFSNRWAVKISEIETAIAHRRAGDGQ